VTAERKTLVWLFAGLVLAALPFPKRMCMGGPPNWIGVVLIYLFAGELIVRKIHSRLTSTRDRLQTQNPEL
jgi:hypothetical protein